jgi:cell division protein FtsB
METFFLSHKIPIFNWNYSVVKSRTGTKRFMFKKIPPLAKNFYVLTSAFLLIWMLFFDQNDFISQYRMKKKLNDLENEYAYYQEKMPEVMLEMRALKNNSSELEKFAREKYLMKKKTEDVFIVKQE